MTLIETIDISYFFSSTALLKFIGLLFSYSISLYIHLVYPYLKKKKIMLGK